jgi:hypothetical protein
MNYIKFVSFVILLFIGNYASGQNSPLSLTINVGGNLSDMRIKDATTDYKFGFREGIGLEVNLPKNFFLQTGLGYAMKGTKSKQTLTGDINGDGITGDVYSSDEKMDASYLILPVKAGYRLKFSDERIRLNFSVGQYLGYGIGGEFKAKEAFRSGMLGDDNDAPHLGPNSSTQYAETEGNTFSSETLKSFDMGLVGEVGVEYNRMLLNIGYEYGLFNFSRGAFSGYNNSLFLTLGYRIF